mgnify:CR=1 FL=1
MEDKKDKQRKDWTSVVDTKDIHGIVRKYNDGESYDEYRRLWRESYDLGKVPDYPIQIDFELNYSCNFRCPMCTWSAESTKGMGKETWFDFEVFKEVISDGVKKGLKVVRLNYINEPLIRKDVVKYINFAREAGVLDVYFSTNGSLLNEQISRTSNTEGQFCKNERQRRRATAIYRLLEKQSRCYRHTGSSKHYQTHDRKSKPKYQIV